MDGYSSGRRPTTSSWQGYLERCVAALDADPAVVLAYPQTDFVHGELHALLDLHDPGWHLVSDDPLQCACCT